MARNIYLPVHPRRLFKDHWCIFIPSAENLNVGTLIEMEGSAREGFSHAVSRLYDLKLSDRKPRTFLLGQVGDDQVHATPAGGHLVMYDLTPPDNVERCALSLPAPGPSMNPTATNAV